MLLERKDIPSFCPLPPKNLCVTVCAFARFLPTLSGTDSCSSLALIFYAISNSSSLPIFYLLALSLSLTFFLPHNIHFLTTTAKRNNMRSTSPDSIIRRGPGRK
ncbi:hypothetical protein ILYODFUR_026186 [Ilyodon furcidens]|uniref:Uncharacterized protein n=1 Tax=Ilyodon furcidens TaxID=33524 RepID=A0ABV0VI80_9TELE